MAKMYGKFDARKQNSKGWTKAQMRHDEERQIAKDVQAEETFTQDCPHGLSVREDIAGLNACLECWCLARGLDPATTEDYEIG
jgi:hypothetical protein